MDRKQEICIIGICLILLTGCFIAQAQDDTDTMEISGDPSAFRYFDVTGRRAFLMGREGGAMEAWILPFKIARNIRIGFDREDFPEPLKSVGMKLIRIAAAAIFSVITMVTISQIITIAAQMTQRTMRTRMESAAQRTTAY